MPPSSSKPARVLIRVHGVQYPPTASTPPAFPPSPTLNLCPDASIVSVLPLINLAKFPQTCDVSEHGSKSRNSRCARRKIRQNARGSGPTFTGERGRRRLPLAKALP